MRALNFDGFPLERSNSRRSDANVETSLERLSWLMDDLFRVPVLGWRFGESREVFLATDDTDSLR